MKKSSKATLQGFRRGATRWRGRGGRGGASGLLEGTRGRQWPQCCSSSAAGAFGPRCGGEGERGRADRDDAGAFTHASTGSAASRRRRGASRARALSRLCLLAEVRDDWHQARWAGPAQVRPRWAWWAPGKCPGESLSLFYFSFSISVILFWFSLETKPF